MKSKVLMGLVIVLALALSACGGNEGSGSEGKENATKTESSTSGDKKDADKESKTNSKKKEVSLESLETLEESPAEDFEFMPDGMNSKGWSLYGYNGKDEMVVIPEEVDGKKVVSIISEAFGEGSGVKAVKIPDSVEVISRGFVGNEDLQYVIFGNGLKEIDDCAFQGCNALKRVELNEGLEKLGANSFWAVDNLEYIYVPDTVTSIAVTAIGSNADNFVLAGKAGSTAEEYAKERNYTFEVVE